MFVESVISVLPSIEYISRPLYSIPLILTPRSWRPRRSGLTAPTFPPTSSPCWRTSRELYTRWPSLRRRSRPVPPKASSPRPTVAGSRRTPTGSTTTRTPWTLSPNCRLSRLPFIAMCIATEPQLQLLTPASITRRTFAKCSDTNPTNSLKWCDSISPSTGWLLLQSRIVTVQPLCRSSQLFSIHQKRSLTFKSWFTFLI